MPELPDGTILPSFLGVEPMGAPQEDGNQNNVELRWGEVLEAIYPDDARNTGKKKVFTEYVVAVAHQEGRGSHSKTYYNGVALENLFGSLADYLKYTLRTAKDGAPAQPGAYGVGAKVLLLCINGNTTQAIILGGTRDAQNDTQADQRSLGHHLDFAFNGLQVAIADDGGLTVTFNGKTKVDGTLDGSASKDAQGSTVKMTKDGSVVIASPDGKQSLKVDHGVHKVNLTADQEMDLTCEGQVVVKSAGMKVGAATDQWPLFTTYRREESQANQAAIQTLEGMGEQMAAAAAGLTAAATALAGGPDAAAAPGLTAAAAAAAAMASAAGAWAAALQQMEALSSQYLSQKNTND